MSKKKVGAVAIDMAGEPQEPYRLINCDIYECLSCGAEIASGFAVKGVEKHERHFEGSLRLVLTSGEKIVRNYEVGKAPLLEVRRAAPIKETFVACPGCQHRYYVERVRHFLCVYCSTWDCFFFNVDSKIVARWFHRTGKSEPVDQPTNFGIIE